MSSLVGIAPELVKLICSNLSTGDILSLCKTCKSLYSAAHPLLFRNITIARNWRATPDKLSQVTSLLLFLLRHPSYAGYIKTVDIPRLHYDECDFCSLYILENGNPSPMSQEDTALVRAAIEQCCLPGTDEDYFPNAKDWEVGVVGEVNPAAVIALILVQCTHLQGLTVNVNLIPPQNKWFPHFIRVALSATEGTSRPSSFNKLTNLTWGSMSELSRFNEPQSPLSEELILLSFYLPSVNALSFNAKLSKSLYKAQSPASTGHEGFKWPLLEHPLATNLTTLRLDFYSWNSPASIESLLRQTPNLQSLVCNCSLEWSSSPLDLSALRQGLDHVRGTLNHLVLRLEILVDASDPVTWTSLGPLCALTALEDLEIPLAILFGKFIPWTELDLAAFLPCGLKRLAISDHGIINNGGGNDEERSRGHSWRLPWGDANFYEWPARPASVLLMEFFAGGWKTATPLLEEFVLNVNQEGQASHEYWSNDEERRGLRQLVESQGIKCSINLDRTE